MQLIGVITLPDILTVIDDIQKLSDGTQQSLVQALQEDAGKRFDVSSCSKDRQPLQSLIYWEDALKADGKKSNCSKEALAKLLITFTAAQVQNDEEIKLLEKLARNLDLSGIYACCWCGS